VGLAEGVEDEIKIVAEDDVLRLESDTGAEEDWLTTVGVADGEDVGTDTETGVEVLKAAVLLSTLATVGEVAGGSGDQ
jgi:hypothetical protein